MVFNTKEGKELQKYCGNNRDYIGHGAIRHYFGNFTGGIEHEYTDFSSPDNFPKEIVEAIKAGQFRGLGIDEGLLTKKAWAEYNKIEQPARAEYEKIRQSARAEYDKIKQSAFWDLFKNKKNRPKCWR
jgi:hypothetical protein